MFLQILVQLESSVVEIRAQVQTTAANYQQQQYPTKVDALEEELRRIWVDADCELQVFAEEMKSIYGKSNMEMDTISRNTRELLALHAKEISRDLRSALLI